MNPSRRRFLFAGAATLVAAPAIVRVAANLMPVSTKAIALNELDIIGSGFLTREEVVFLDGMSQTLEQTIWYGDGSRTPMGFSGFAALLSNHEARIA